jgi:hypothetical protein
LLVPLALGFLATLPRANPRLRSFLLLGRGPLGVEEGPSASSSRGMCIPLPERCPGSSLNACLVNSPSPLVSRIRQYAVIVHLHVAFSGKSDSPTPPLSYVVLPPALDLSFRAKHLFVGAMRSVEMARKQAL